MSQSGSQAAAFFRDVVVHRRVWTVRDSDGYPAPLTSDARRSMPFWSSLARAKKIIGTVAAYSGFEPVEIPLDVWLSTWLPDLNEDEILVGVNWSGARAVGWDFEVEQVLTRISAAERA